MAQVTIGSLIEAKATAILDLKENNLNDFNTTRGLTYPRVELQQNDMLYPMFSSDLDYLSNKPFIDEKHTGLTVYNKTDNQIFTEGIYQWDGKKWQAVNNYELTPTAVGDIDCSRIRMYPATYQAGVPYSGVLVVPYFNGNGGYYTSATIINNNNFTMKLQPGKLNIGYGELYFQVSSNSPTFSSPQKTRVNISDLLGGSGCQNVLVGSESPGKTSRYYKKTTKLRTKISGTTADDSYVVFGHLRMRYRYNLSNERIEFGTTEHINLTYHWIKAGSGGIDYWSGGQVRSKGHSNPGSELSLFTDGDNQKDHGGGNVRGLNATNRDIGQAIIILHHANFQEVYRISVNIHEKLGATDGGYVTFFIEFME